MGPSRASALAACPPPSWRLPSQCCSVGHGWAHGSLADAQRCEHALLHLLSAGGCARPPERRTPGTRLREEIVAQLGGAAPDVQVRGALACIVHALLIRRRVNATAQAFLLRSKSASRPFACSSPAPAAAVRVGSRMLRWRRACGQASSARSSQGAMARLRCTAVAWQDCLAHPECYFRLQLAEQRLGSMWLQGYRQLTPAVGGCAGRLHPSGKPGCLSCTTPAFRRPGLLCSQP